MKRLPPISIVVPSFNQADYLAETLQSLVDQEYPQLEVIIQDGGSKDGSVAIAEDFVQRYPNMFRLYVEKDSGQADAINRGFARASGEILAFLNSDDTYFPRILHRVAEEIDPARQRYVVMGRSIFTGENSRYVGVEHPAEFISHFEHLAIWRRGFNTIPQPSVFWHRKVWERFGGMDVNEHHALDYDLFCRFSKHYHIHFVDELWSTYRMHDSSKSSQRTEAEVLDLTIAVSRKHWGAWYFPLRWRCELSYRFYSSQYRERARHHARRAEEAFKNRRFFRAVLESLQTLRFSPAMARDRLLYGWLAGRGVRLAEKLVMRSDGYTGRYGDSWIGPVYREQVTIPRDGRRLVVELSHAPHGRHKKIRVKLLINGTLACVNDVKEAGPFLLEADITPYQGASIAVELRANSCFIPREIFGVEDNRRLAMMLSAVKIEPIKLARL